MGDENAAQAFCNNITLLMVDDAPKAALRARGWLKKNEWRAMRRRVFLDEERDRLCRLGMGVLPIDIGGKVRFFLCREANAEFGAPP